MSDRSTKIEQFTSLLLRDIEQGVYGPGDRLPSERELAERYQLAHVTVSKALNGLVGARYLERRPRVGTFVTRRPRLKSAVVVMDYRSLHAPYPQTLQYALTDLGYILSAFDINQLGAQADLFRETCRAYRPELVLFEGYSIFPFELVEGIADARVVMFHKCEHAPLPRAWHILCDYEDLGWQSARAVLAHGRRRVAVFTGRTDSPMHSDHRYVAGARRAFREAGLEGPLAVLEEPELTPERLERLLGREGCDGVAAVLDSHLVPLVELARRLGRAIPDDLTLVGHKNTPWAESYHLTSMDPRPDRLVAALKAMLAEAPPPGTTAWFKSTPVWRASCPAPAPANVGVV